MQKANNNCHMHLLENNVLIMYLSPLLTFNMKPFSMHSVLFFVPDDICNLISGDTVQKIVIAVLCVLLGISLAGLYRRIVHGFPLLEGMTTDNANANANGDTPSQTNTLTHANVNADDPSKTKIPNINMS